MRRMAVVTSATALVGVAALAGAVALGATGPEPPEPAAPASTPPASTPADPVHTRGPAVAPEGTGAAARAGSVADRDRPGAPNATAGAGVADDADLRPVDRLTITEDGTILDGVEVHGQIDVEADDVTIRDSRVRTDGHHYGIRVHGGADDVLLEDVDVRGTDERCRIGVVGARYTARRLDVSGCEDGFRVGSDTTVEDSHVHDLRVTDDSHNDAIQSTGARGLRIVGNTLEAPYRAQTAAILLQSNNAPVDDVLIEDNRLSGGTYTVYLRDKDEGHGPPSDVVVRDNVWVRESWRYGLLSRDAGDGFTWEGNATEGEDGSRTPLGEPDG